MRISSFPWSLLMLATGALMWSCGSPAKQDAGSGGDNATGGATGTGGSIASGGMTSTGGAAGTTSSGGTVSSGGTKGTGGTTATGGSVSTGGTSATGGTTATGGTKATGGATGTGGTAATGGTKSTGGTVGSGGTASTGGNSATGGSKATGGSTSVDAGATTKTIPGNGCTPPAAYANLFVSLSGHTQAESDAKVAAAWSKLFNPKGPGNIYFDGPGSDESYVKDIYNGDVRSEGMGYGMIIAVQLDHQTEFDRLWTWVKTHMANGTGEIVMAVPDLGLENVRRWSAGRRRVHGDRPHLCPQALGRHVREVQLRNRGPVGARRDPDQVLQLPVPPRQVRLGLQ